MAKILIVDDEIAIRTLYEEAMAEEGHDVFSTQNCGGLMELIREQKPDVVVLDIKMGRYNGLDILQDIRKQFYNTPVILSTAYSTFKHDLKAISADYYVVKSADLRELKMKIDMALEGIVSSVPSHPKKKDGKASQSNMA
jgi:DNA-binding response OmpR family regulator